MLRDRLEKNNLKRFARVYMYTENNGTVSEEEGTLYRREAVLSEDGWEPGDSVFVPDTLPLDSDIDISELRCAARNYVIYRNRLYTHCPNKENAIKVFNQYNKERRLKYENNYWRTLRWKIDRTDQKSRKK